MDYLSLPRCADCPYHFRNDSTTSMIYYGLLLNPDDRACTGGKRVRKFKSGDPSVRVPSWCPRRKAPCEVRIYGFKDALCQFLHEELCRDLRRDAAPLETRYALVKSTTTELTPKQFWENSQTLSDGELVGAAIETYQIVEIDDGLKPVLFYKGKDGRYKIDWLFDTKMISTVLEAGAPPKERGQGREEVQFVGNLPNDAEGGQRLC